MATQGLFSTLWIRPTETVVFVNKNKSFVTVSDIDDLKSLVSVMSETARNVAENKIRLSSTIANIAEEQFGLPL